MVGLVVSLLVSLVIMQVFAVFEEQKRSTSGSADAQTNGHIALYNLQRDVQLAGFALPIFSSSNSPLQCTTFTPSGTNISPVSITDGGTASDTLTVQYGTADAGGSPAAISSVSANTARVLYNAGCKDGDQAIVSLGNDCALNTVTDITGTTEISFDSSNLITSGANISCLGQWMTVSYSINDDFQLLRSENGSNSPNVAEIVNLQAQYGVSASANSNTVTDWVNASGTTWGNPSNANRNRIKAIRVAIVARNGLLEKEEVSTACNSLESTNPRGICAWAGSARNPAPNIDLTSITDWQRYRYRVFTTIIPLRNVIWAKDALPT
jgi:type IV pilus assembly protein PilW